jgi:hypothetical protein
MHRHRSFREYERRACARAPGLAAALVACGGLAAAQQDAPQKPQQDQDGFSKALDQALAEQAKAKESATPALDLFQGMNLKLLDVSLDALFAAGTSTEQDESIEELQAGGHDPHQRGFTIQNVELSALGAVDPFFDLEAHLIYFIDAEGESQFELEEAFATTRALPAGLQLEAGQFLTEFGRINPQHPHQWDFIDQPVIHGRVFGPDGMRGPGFRLGWLAPLPWFAELHVGMQNANGETMTSFLGSDEEEAPGGHVVEEHETTSLADFVWLGRVHQSWDLREDVVTQLGTSALWGPNSAGDDTRTSVYGADLRVKWQPRRNDAGWPFLVWQTEVIRRRFGTSLQSVDPDGVPASGDEFSIDGDTLRDTGLYTYLYWGFRRDWIAGLRYEYATSSGNGLEPRDEDPSRDDRTRVSPLLAWAPTHFSRVRLQYDLDFARHLEQDRAHSVWLGLEVLIGRHPAHKY